MCLAELVPVRIFHGWRFRTRFAQGEEAPRIRCSQPGRNAVLIPLKGHNLTRVEQRCQWDRVHQAAGTLVWSHHTVSTPLSSQCHGVFGGMVPWGPEGLLGSACFFNLKN